MPRKSPRLAISKEIAVDLEVARAQIDSDPGAALARLLAVWRATPAIVLANAIELVGAWAARGLNAPPGISVDDREARWQAEARRDDPVTRHALIASITDTARVEAQLARCATLVELRDPRVTRKLLAMMAGVPPLTRVGTFWTPMFALLARCGDPEVRPRLVNLALASRLRQVSHRTRAEFAARMAKVNARLADAYPHPPPELAAADAATVKAIHAHVEARAHLPEGESSPVERALLAAVYASPADDGPRAIYGDWLQQRNDPRGELIALQLGARWNDPEWRDGPAPARIAHLLEQHRTRWLGPIARCLARAELKRGFLDGAWIASAHPPPDEMWSTVTSVTGGLPATDAFPMPALESADELDTAAVVHLATLSQPPPLQRLGWRSSAHDTTPALVAIAAYRRVLPRLPALRYLRLDTPGGDALTPADLAWPWRDTTVRTLRVTGGLGVLGAWLEAIAGSQLDELELFGTAGTAWRITVTRDDAGALSRLKVDRGYLQHRFPADVEAIAAVVERSSITALELDVPDRAWAGATAGVRRRLARALVPAR